MPEGDWITFKVFEGPNLVVPFAAIVAEFDDPFSTTLPSDKIEPLLNELFPFSSRISLSLPEGQTDFVSLVMVLTNTWRERLGLNAIPSLITQLNKSRFQIAVGLDGLGSPKNIFSIGLEMARAIFAHASGAAANIQDVSQKIQRILSEIRRQPGSRFTRALTRVSSERGIPIYPVYPPKNIYMCGQGARGFHFWSTANSEDSLTGWLLSQDKAATNQFLRRLGFPTVVQEIAADGNAASRIADEMGYPVVVKPVDQNFGIGVAVELYTEAELRPAYARARAASPTRQALVERYVPGDDHRLTVFGGKLIVVSRLSPPYVVGDGKQSIIELIEAENRVRGGDPAANIYGPKLTIDADMKEQLRGQGYVPEDRPPQGLKLRLRKTSNLHTGGSREQVSEIIHPDNILMAETIAKNFHLDAAGIDFITPDISKAWHEVACAVIEVNGNPGVTHDAPIRKLLLEKFPLDGNGCIPSLLIVGDDADILSHVLDRVEACGVCVGYTSGKLTSLAGQKRSHEAGDLPARILGLLLDTTCEALVVSCTADEIVDYGIPHTRFDIAMILDSAEVSDELHRLISENTTTCIKGATLQSLDKSIAPLIDALSSAN